MVFKKGNTPHNKGKKSSEETREKISLNHWDSSGDKNPNFGKTGELSPLFGKKQPIEWQEKKSKALIGRKRPDLAMYGEDNPAWKGGKSSLNKSIRDCAQYSDWRIQVFGRDNFTCQDCGVRGSWLEVHHKVAFYKILEDNNILTMEEALLCNALWDIDNGITYCKPCHDKTTFE